MAEETTEYIDLGDRWLEIDNSGPVQKRTVLPKSTRDVGVSVQMRQELEARIEADAAAQKLAEESDPKDNLPPAESDEDREKREKKAQEAIAKQDKIQAGEVEQAAPKAESKKS